MDIDEFFTRNKRRFRWICSTDSEQKEGIRRIKSKIQSKSRYNKIRYREAVCPQANGYSERMILFEDLPLVIGDLMRFEINSITLMGFGRESSRDIRLIRRLYRDSGVKIFSKN